MSYIEKKVGNYTMCLRPDECGIHSNLVKIAKVADKENPDYYIL